MTRLIGRESEQEIINRLYKDVFTDNETGVVYIYGDAGIGKSTLVKVFTDKIKDDADIYILQTEANIKRSFQLFKELLEKYFNCEDIEDNDRKKTVYEKSFEKFITNIESITDNENIKTSLKHSKEVLGSLIDLWWEGSLYEKADAKTRYNKVIEALQSFIYILSRFNMLVFIVEDLHWIDVYSNDTLKYILNKSEDLRLLLLITSRYERGLKYKIDFENKNIKQIDIELGEIDKENAKELITQQLKKDVDFGLVDFIYKRTGGNPFYIEQYCLYLQQSGMMVLEEGYYRLKETALKFPMGTRVAIITRINNLVEEVKEVAAVASVLGMEFDIKLLMEVVRIMNTFINNHNNSDLIQISTEDVEVYMYKGEEIKLWNDVSNIKYTFNHPLLQKTMYDILPEHKLKLLHGFVAEAIENIYIDNASYYTDLSYHYEKAGNRDKTKIYLLKAFKYAKSNFHNSEALEIADKLIEDKYLKSFNSIVELKIEICKVYHNIGEWKKSIRIIEEIDNVSDSITNEMLKANVKEYLGGLYWKVGRIEESFKLQYKAKEIYEKNGDVGKVASTIGNIGNLYYSIGKYEKAMKCFRDQEEISMQLGDEFQRSVALLNIACVYGQSDKFEESLDALKQCIGFLKDTEKDHTYSIALLNTGHLYFRMNKHDDAVKYLKIAKEVAGRIEYNEIIYRADELIATIKMRSGHIDDALQMFFELRKIYMRIEDMVGSVHVLSNIGFCNLLKDDFITAAKYYDIAINIELEQEIQTQLPYLYHNKSYLLFDFFEKYEEAFQYAKQSLVLAEKYKQNSIVMKSKILIARYYALNNIREGETKLLELLNDEHLKREDLASVYRYLYEFSNNEIYKNKALKLYEKLYKEEQNYYYKKLHDELNI